MAYGKLSLLQSRAQPLPLCSLPVQPFAGMSRQSALPRRQQTTTSLGAPPSNGDWPLIFGLYILHCKQPLLLRLHCNGSASSTRPGPHARPRPWLSCCPAGIGLHNVLVGGETPRRVLVVWGVLCGRVLLGACGLLCGRLWFLAGTVLVLTVIRVCGDV